MSFPPGKGEAKGPPGPRRVKKRTTEYDVGKPSVPDVRGSFRIQRPVSYEERVLLAWANSDEDVRTLTKNSWIGADADDRLEDAVEFIIDWNLDTLHPYWHLYEPNGRSFEEELKRLDKESDPQKRIRGKHQLAEDLMDFLNMELQRTKDRMKGFPEDEDLMAYADAEYR
jgi:hypothetical protein